MRGVSVVLRLCVFVTTAACTASASASERDEVDENHPGRHHDEHPNLVGLRVGFLSLFESEESEVLYRAALFIGLSYERTVIHEWLELEVSVPVAMTFDEDPLLALPIDVHIKKPFHPVAWASPYVAIGPTFDVIVRPEAAVYFGGSVAVGTYLWPTPQIGVDLEVDYNLVAERGRPTHELLLAAGPVFRF